MRFSAARCGGVALVLAASLIVSAAQAQTSRLGDVDYYGMTTYVSGGGGTVKNSDVHWDLDHLWMWGGGGDYFFTDKLSVLFDLAFGVSDLHLSDSRALSGPSFTQNADFFSGRLNLELTPLPTAFSPVVSAGIGFNNIETAVPGAAPQAYCVPGVYYWWCGTGVPTYSETAFSWNVGVGARLDITPSLFLKLMYSSNWSDFNGLGTRRADQVLLQIGGRVHTR